MKYVQFFHNGTDGKPRAMCGSDGVMLVDGRWCRETIEDTARTHAARLNAALGKGITGFTIVRGSLATPAPSNAPVYPI